MLPRRLAALSALLVVLPAFAGCTDDEAPGAEKLTPGSTGNGGGTPTGTGGSSPTTPSVAPPKPRSPNERWHFHDYWGRSPTITLLDANLTLVPTVGGDGLPALSALVELPQGTIVPPETGSLTFNVTWNGTTSGLLNLTYRPADSNDFLPGADLAHGTPFDLPTTESMCDVPHRQQSFWRFNLTAKPGGTPPAAPPKDFRLTITATIGRPLFIDAPHVNWWQAGDVVPLVQERAGEFSGAATPAGNLSVPAPGALTPQNARPAAFTQGMRVAVDEGRIVPEGAKSVVVMLNWTGDVPNGKLKVRWKEGNSLTEGAMDVATDGANGRVFAIPVTPGQTDTTYSNRTTWEFHVLPDNEPPAFKGAFTLHAWATRLQPAAAAALVSAPAE